MLDLKNVSNLKRSSLSTRTRDPCAQGKRLALKNACLDFSNGTTDMVKAVCPINLWDKLIF